jgi:hypothetical protein
LRMVLRVLNPASPPAHERAAVVLPPARPTLEMVAWSMNPNSPTEKSLDNTLSDEMTWFNPSNLPVNAAPLTDPIGVNGVLLLLLAEASMSRPSA